MVFFAEISPSDQILGEPMATQIPDNARQHVRDLVKSLSGISEIRGLTRSPLNGLRRDAIFAVLCGCDHNIRKILRYLRALFANLLAAFIIAIQTTRDRVTGNLAQYSATVA